MQRFLNVYSHLLTWWSTRGSWESSDLLYVKMYRRINYGIVWLMTLIPILRMWGYYIYVHFPKLNVMNVLLWNYQAVWICVVILSSPLSEWLKQVQFACASQDESINECFEGEFYQSRFHWEWAQLVVRFVKAYEYLPLLTWMALSIYLRELDSGLLPGSMCFGALPLITLIINARRQFGNHSRLPLFPQHRSLWTGLLCYSSAIEQWELRDRITLFSTLTRRRDPRLDVLHSRLRYLILRSIYWIR